MVQLHSSSASDIDSLRAENQQLRTALEELQTKVREPEEIVRAIRQGEVDAFVVTESPGERIYTLRSADLLYRVLIEEMKEGAVALDEDGIILYCNWHFASMIKRERETILGASILPFLPPESRRVLEMLREAEPSGARRQEVVLQAADGTSVPVMLTINPIRLDEPLVFCLIVTDLTEQKRQQELLTIAQRKDVFLAMLSHELRNPIAPIGNAAHVLRLPGVSAEDVRWAGDVIERQVRQLSRLVDDLLDVARINSGKINLHMDTVDLRGVIGAAIEETRPGIDGREHELTVELPPTPLLLYGDAARLTQVVANLLSNAAKFTPSPGRIWVTAQRQGEEALVEVRDSGIGIPPEMLPRVFEVFTQADSGVGRTHDGLGIGLALVKTLVELHGGQASATSEGAGRGSQFSLRLPLLAEQPAQGGSDYQPTESLPPTPSRRVLVVDDNPDAAESLAMLVRQWGHEACVAVSAGAALEEAARRRPDVIFLDIGMPGTNGYEIARQIRKLPQMDRAILVAVTGYGQEDDRRRSREAGFDHHWVKPARLEAIEALLRQGSDRR